MYYLYIYYLLYIQMLRMHLYILLVLLVYLQKSIKLSLIYWLLISECSTCFCSISTYCFNSSSNGGFVCREIVLYIEHTNKAFNKEKINSFNKEKTNFQQRKNKLELDKVTRLLSNSRDSIFHSAHVIIVYLIHLH